MGRQTLLAVVCWLTLNLTLGDKRTHSSGLLDNESAESAPRLYRNVPLGVYASAAPYGAHSFHLPTFIAAPKSSASQVVPVKENYVNHLTDSYGNKFVGTPQLSSYKIGFPQQFVSLQTKLPEHLAQPLVAASANYQFKPSNGQFFGVPYRVPALHGPAPTPLNHFPTFGQLYGERVQNLAPSLVVHSQAYGIPNTQQQSTNNKAVFTNTHTQNKYNNHKGEQNVFKQKEPQLIIGKPKIQGVKEITNDGHGQGEFQRIQEVSHSSYGEPKFQRIQQEPAHYKDLKSQKIEDAPVLHHDQSKLKQQHQSSDSEEKYQRVQEFPHYESKFQIIEEQPKSPQFHRIQEHHPSQGEVKFQRVHEAPSVAQTQQIYEGSQEKPHHGEIAKISYDRNANLQAAPGKQTVTYINDINGEKTVVELETKPSLPLLDLTLLEPLTFENPLVPQVQHFLPRISQATYQKLPEALPAGKKYQKEYAIQKTTSYNSADGHNKPQKEESKKKHKKPTQSNKYPKKNDVPKKTTVTYHETLDDAPEIIYEINSPNYKETVKQKAVSYNKETQSEPVHYTYGSNSEKEPVTYSYTRTSKEPVQIKSLQYHGNGPSHLIYMFKPEEQAHEEKSHSSAPHNSESQNKKESSHESDDDKPYYHQQYKENPNSAEEQYDHREPAPQEKENYYKQSQEKHQEIEQDHPPKYYSEPVHIISENINFQPILKEYENNIRVLTTPSASIKVDPNQHIHHPKPTPQALVSHQKEFSQQPHDHPHSSPPPQKQSHSSNDHQRSQYHSSPPSEDYNTPAPHIHEKSKRIIIQEESPDEMHMLREQMREEVVKQEENNEDDFEKGYHDAAIGFPAYNRKTSNPEKDIFDPESYGVPRDHSQYDFEHTPLQQYQEEGDEFPTETRSRYKDARDKTMQNYYSDFSISKPESLLDRYQNKLGYYKLYKEQKPDYLHDDEEDDKKQQKSAKYSAAPSFVFTSPDDRSKSYYGSSTPKQQLYEYDYSKGTPRDSSAFASRPYQNYKSRTSFVEPQFQYGFEPIAIPKLLDSELAAMASNDSPESEKPGMRKKIYKENWYIKKTSTSAGTPAS